MELTFMPEQIRWTGNPGKTLLEIAAEAGVAIDGNCAGAGTCGKCKVRIVAGNITEPCEAERNKLTGRELENGYRLACRFRPTENAAVEVPLAEGAAKRKTKLLELKNKIPLDPMIAKQVISVERATLSDQRSDEARMIDACKDGPFVISPALLADIPSLLKRGCRLTVTTCEKEMIHIEEGEKAEACYGLSFDIGTTTIVGMLWNLSTGERMSAVARTNPQGIYGADVISRITYAGESRENLANIHSRAIDCLNEIIGVLAEETGIKSENIYDVTVVGNTTMCHLFMEVNPIQLAQSPFSPVFCGSVCGNAKHHGLRVNSLARFYLLPCIAGHVGSDITAGLIATDMIKAGEAQLMLDVGTNGEIVLAVGGKAIACSTAAGPAFEGASIFQGMRAAAGAIETVEINEDGVSVETIENAPPIGLCGSGIIDAVAELIRTGVTDRTGRLLTAEKLEEKGFSPEIAGRVRKGENGREFVLAYREDADDIVITQMDIREVQLAKAAISAGIRIMMKEMHVKEEDLAKILIAGAFGNYIKTESAITVGLIPDIGRERIAYIGNAAGIGASLALLSGKKRKEAEEASRSIIHLELSAYPEFQEEYLKAMMF